MPDTTIPIDHLEALGGAQSNEGLHDSDPAIRFRGAEGFEWSWHPRDSSERGWPEARAMVLVEPSMPALLRCLARQYGATLEPGEVPRWVGRSKGRWWLEWGELRFYAFRPSALSATVFPDESTVPALTADMGRFESLAAVIAWRVSQ